jgi:hypothetical protein
MDWEREEKRREINKKEEGRGVRIKETRKRRNKDTKAKILYWRKG